MENQLLLPTFFFLLHEEIKRNKGIVHPEMIIILILMISPRRAFCPLRAIGMIKN